MPAVVSNNETTETFKSVGMAVPIFRYDCAEYAIFYAPNYLCVVSRSDRAWFETTIAPSGITASVKPAQNVNSFSAQRGVVSLRSYKWHDVRGEGGLAGSKL